MSRRIIKTDNAPAPVGTYNQGIVITGGSLLYTAGQISIDPKTNEVIKGTVEEQTRMALNNLKAILTEAGTSMDNMVKLTVFMIDLSHFATVNKVFLEFFSEENAPARSAVEISGLPKGLDVEIEGIALIK